MTPNRILAGYYCDDSEPQRGVVRFGPDNDMLIEPFFHSATRLQVPVTILHQDLSDRFTRRWTTPLFDFHRVDPIDRKIGRDCNHYRYYHYKNYLEQHDQLRKVFCVDLFDVLVNRHPFRLIDRDNCLYAGTEPCLLGELPWVLGQIKLVNPGYDQEWLHQQRMLNAGCIGGSREAMLWFFTRATEHFARIRAEHGEPMPFNELGLFNYILHCECEDGMLQMPDTLVSVFRAYEWDADTAFVHK